MEEIIQDQESIESYIQHVYDRGAKLIEYRLWDGLDFFRYKGWRPKGWHLPNDGEWRDYQKDKSKLDWDNLGRGGCRDWDEYCDETYTGHYWSSTSVEKGTGRAWEFRRQAHSINRSDESVQKGLYVRCVIDLK